jgi:hypothetical protein
MQEGRTQYFGAAADLREQYPETNSLEDAYFAATGELRGRGEIRLSAPITISITDYRSGAVS